MEKGIAQQGYIPIRREPSETSEMVSQVLFGEEFQILETNSKWQRISLDFDGFEGWVAQEGFYSFNTDNGAGITTKTGARMVADPFITLKTLKQDCQLILPAGSILPETGGEIVSPGGHNFQILSEAGVITPGPAIDPEEIGIGLVSLPYLWGGRSGFGFDGPGLVQMLCRMMGLSLPRQCEQQARLGTNINFMHEIKKGDLAFFANEKGELFHVGMIMDGGKILHSSISVRIDKLDQHGIYSIEKEAYTHKLRLIKRVLVPVV